MPGAMKLFSPAKINLFLYVRKKRPDGFHELETLFERLDFGDEIRISSSKELTVKSDSKELPEGSGNIAFRAAALLKQRFGVRAGAGIFIKKRIPVSAGLGGGSSNAATVILGLNHFWKLGLSRKEMLKIGATLGSDVPFFILETPFAIGTGRGEVLRKIPAPGVWIHHVLVKPPFGISTKEAYSALGPSSLTPQKANARLLIHSIQKGRLEPRSPLLTNSLELALNKRVRIISQIKKELLDRGAFGALLSGSGSTVFGLFPDEKSAVRAARILRRDHKDWKVFTASTY
jgi:4-diphosphocytidyl-2-C-methyl-D-erythritol kinase